MRLFPAVALLLVAGIAQAAEKPAFPMCFGPTTALVGLAVSERWLAVSRDDRVQLIDRASGARGPLFMEGRGASEIAFSPDGRRLAVATSRVTQQRIEWFDLEAPTKTRSVATRAGASELAWSPDGKRIFTSDVFRAAQWLDADSGRILGTSGKPGFLVITHAGIVRLELGEDSSSSAALLDERHAEAARWRMPPGNSSVLGVFEGRDLIVAHQPPEANLHKDSSVLLLKPGGETVPIGTIAGSDLYFLIPRPGGTVAAVANGSPQRVYVVDPRGRRVVAHPTGKAGDVGPPLALSPDGRTLYAVQLLEGRDQCVVAIRLDER